MELENIKVGMNLVYIENSERTVVKVVKIDHQENQIHFIDAEGFEWAEEFINIPVVIKGEF